MLTGCNRFMSPVSTSGISMVMDTEKFPEDIFLVGAEHLDARARSQKTHISMI